MDGRCVPLHWFASKNLNFALGHQKWILLKVDKKGVQSRFTLIWSSITCLLLHLSKFLVVPPVTLLRKRGAERERECV